MSGSTVISIWKWRSIRVRDRKSTRLNSSHDQISYAVFCLKKKNVTVQVGDHSGVCTRDVRSVEGGDLEAAFAAVGRQFHSGRRLAHGQARDEGRCLDGDSG